jgi:pyruvate-ferredoxin/flavodoxin oxidoreductase
MVVDGGIAATYVAYAMSDVATIYPITPVEEMGEVADEWRAAGRLNIFGQTMRVCELESELGAAGAAHGVLSGGGLATTFTNSQGLLLMIPNMYKIAGELLPAVFHVATRSLSAHALSIFGDHQDIMACRQTGFAMLGSATVQECMDLALVAHLSAIDASVPFVHFFDGWRTSSEIQTIEPIAYEDMARLVDMEKVRAFRAAAMNPEHPQMRGTAQGPDVYFQNREACNRMHDAVEKIVEANMAKIKRLTGREYHVVEYSGASDADRVVVAMGSGAEVVKEAVAYLNAAGEKVGVVNVRLYRPFPAEKLMAAIPHTARVVAVLDRSKEPGAGGEALYKDVCAAAMECDRNIRVLGGRYGLSSKQFSPSMARDVFRMMADANAKRHFTVGIVDDVTHLSIPAGRPINTMAKDVRQFKFFGIGSDGTVGATKDLVRLIGENTDLYTQGYFQYSAKKSGGYTISDLRVAPHPISASYLIENPDFISCNKDIYTRRYDVLEGIVEGGTFLLNTNVGAAGVALLLPASMKRELATKHIKFYIIDAESVADKYGLGNRINMIMSAAFLHLADFMPENQALSLLKSDINRMYIHEGQTVVDANCNAVDAAISALTAVDVPADWATATDAPETPVPVPVFISKIAKPMNAMRGNELPVSLFDPRGIIPPGTTAYEKRRVAVKIPRWIPENCVQCTMCSLVCAHAAIRPFVATDQEVADAPASVVTVPTNGTKLAGYRWRIQVYPEDCVGCSLCAHVCPGKALEMTPVEQLLSTEIANLDYCREHISIKDNLLERNTIRGTQLYQPLLEFSGACGGCGETPYVKLLTQLFGERLLIANATGCSSIWGGDMPSNPYTVNRHGQGPAWANSLFEDNAEYGLGIATAIEQRRQRLADNARKALEEPFLQADARNAVNSWLSEMDDATQSATAGAALVDALRGYEGVEIIDEILRDSDLLTKKSVWCVGGDGWAYDIGFAGLDHVLASGKNINILVLDTECYSNTGGNTSKATPLGCVAKYNIAGKRTVRKELARMEMVYGDIYVASVCLGADPQHTIDALWEAESFDGPSLVVAYCPCIAHGIRTGMGTDIEEAAHAVRAGYWPLFRFDPRRVAEGRPPLSVDCPDPDGTLYDMLDNEDRYADLVATHPDVAAKLRPALRDRLESIHKILKDESSISE